MVALTELGKRMRASLKMRQHEWTEYMCPAGYMEKVKIILSSQDCSATPVGKRRHLGVRILHSIR